MQQQWHVQQHLQQQHYQQQQYVQQMQQQQYAQQQQQQQQYIGGWGGPGYAGGTPLQGLPMGAGMMMQPMQQPGMSPHVLQQQSAHGQHLAQGPAPVAIGAGGHGHMAPPQQQQPQQWTGYGAPPPGTSR
jgi:hypothetical protein